MLIEIRPRDRIREERNLVVKLGTAPDGLPLLLGIDRGEAPENLLAPVARVMGNDPRPESWSGALHEVANEVRTIADARQFVARDDHAWYLSWADLNQLLGPTLMERLSRRQRHESVGPVMMQPQQADNAGEPETHTHVNYATYNLPRTADEGAEQPDLQAVVRRHEALTSSKLALQLDADLCAVARIPRGDGEMDLGRPLVEERLSAFESAGFVAWRDSEIVRQGAMGPEYIKARQDLVGETLSWAFTVHRMDLLELVVQTARQLAEEHQQNRIHGDIKPSNMLVGGDGPRLIDSLGIPVGQPSFGLTPRFAAPEQVLTEPVGPATDQFGLAVLTLDLMGALLYGELCSFTIPVGRRQLETVTLLKDPRVFLDPDALGTPAEALQRLRDLLERALAFDPDRRHPSLTDFADGLQALLEEHTFNGTLDAALSFGSLVSTEGGLAWITHDQHPDAAQSRSPAAQ
jgi:hypothetical protein